MHIDSEFIMQLESMLNGVVADDSFTEEIAKAAASYLAWSLKKKSIYPNVPERYMFEKLDGDWSSPSQEQWHQPLNRVALVNSLGTQDCPATRNVTFARTFHWIRTQHHLPAPVNLECPYCKSNNSLYSSMLEGMLCMNCDTVFVSDEMFELLSQPVPEVEEPEHMIDSSADVDDEGFVEYGNK